MVNNHIQPTAVVHEYPGQSGRLSSWVLDLRGRLWTLRAPEFHDSLSIIPSPPFVAPRSNSVSFFVSHPLFYLRNGSQH